MEEEQYLSVFFNIAERKKHKFKKHLWISNRINTKNILTIPTQQEKKLKINQKGELVFKLKQEKLQKQH